MTEMVIVGGGQAGYSVASKLRDMGFKGSIDIICAEDSIPYQRPPLSKKFLMGEILQERLFIRPEAFYRENDIRLRLGVSVIKIDRISSEIFCSDGNKISYKKLFLTTGSTPKTFPENLGGKLKAIYYIRSLTDIEAITDEFKPKKHLLVIGGGYIGLEIAAVARKKNLSVTLVEAEDRILKRVASAQTANFFRDLHNENGVTIIEGRSINRLTGKKNVFRSALLDNGSEIFADFVVIGIGVKPCSSLASEAGLEVDNGIKVDCFCQTSDFDILSAGDCANFPNNSGRLRLESVGNAIDQAEVAARTALGVKEPYYAKPWFWSDQYNVKLQIVGLSSEYDQVVERRDKKAASFWYFQNARLIAVDSINDGRAYMVAKRLIELGISPDPFIISDPSLDLKLLLKSH